LCASIPNPLFDLAGITCGHFMVPFWTFFGATLIGKAIIKMHIQKLFVIFLFSKHHLDKILDLLTSVPYVGENAQPLFKEWLAAEKNKLHHGTAHKSENILSRIMNLIVFLMILYFAVSIVNALAQKRIKRLSQSALHETSREGSSVTSIKIAND
jgi:hypothetical protein